MAFRAFIAVETGEGFRSEQVLGELGRSGADIKLVEPRNLHITLKFLGDTGEDRVEAIGRAMGDSVRGIAPFELAFRGLGAFPNPMAPRVVWVGLLGAEPLAEISRRLEDRLSVVGFPREQRGFSPHITLGRMRTPGRWGSIPALLQTRADADLGSTTVEKLLLKKSVLGPRGPAYSTVLESLLTDQAH
jgi:2'-5' RNA ligase